jgi:hypothetical protein
MVLFLANKCSMTSVFSTFALVAISVLACAGQEPSSFIEVRVVDELVEEFSDHLEESKIGYRQGEQNRFEVNYEGSRVRASGSIVADFLERKKIPLANIDYFDDGQIVLCCNIPGFEYSYLMLYYGDDVLESMTRIVERAIMENGSRFLCDSCEADVAIEGRNIVITYSGAAVKSSVAQLRLGLGGRGSSLKFSLSNAVLTEFSATFAGGGGLAQDYFDSHVIQRF